MDLIEYFYGITKVDVSDETALLPRYNLFSMYAKYQKTFDMKHMIFIASVYGQYKFCLFAGAEMSGVYYFDTAEGKSVFSTSFATLLRNF